MPDFYRTHTHSSDKDQRSMKRLKRLLVIWILLFLAVMIYSLFG